MLKRGRNSRFHPANSVCLTKMPFCRRMETHNRPARELEKVHEKAPRLDARAVEKMAALRMRGSATT